MSDKPLQEALRDLIAAMDAAMDSAGGDAEWLAPIDAALTTARASLEAAEEGGTDPCPFCEEMRKAQPTIEKLREIQRELQAMLDAGPEPDYRGALENLTAAVEWVNESASYGRLTPECADWMRKSRALLDTKGEQDG